MSYARARRSDSRWCLGYGGRGAFRGVRGRGRFFRGARPGNRDDSYNDVSRQRIAGSSAVVVRVLVHPVRRHRSFTRSRSF